MFNKKTFLAFCVITQIVNAMDSLIVLQNGLDGYSGCKDTYIQLGGYQVPHFQSDTMHIGDYYCTT